MFTRILLPSLALAGLAAFTSAQFGSAIDIAGGSQPDAAAVADTNLLGTEALAGFTFADDDEVRKIGYMGHKRYVRLTITPASNTGAWDIAALALLGRPRHAPSQTADVAVVTQVP